LLYSPFFPRHTSTSFPVRYNLSISKTVNHVSAHSVNYLTALYTSVARYVMFLQA